MKRMLVLLLVVCTLFTLGLTNTAQADTLALSLVMDGSGSIWPADWDMMLQGYANAITNPAILPQDGTVALNVIQFSYDGWEVEEIPFTLIDSQAAADSFAALLLGITQQGGLTCISCGIELGTTTLLPLAGSYDRLVIDVTTDGYWNEGIDPYNAAVQAVDVDGIDAVNSLGIGVPAVFNYGTDSFNLQVAGFADFEAAISEKIRREVNGVPEPATLLLLGAGFIGIGAMRRKLRR